ncbi:uncharacterized protein H6S33_010332 [Morchella sextelata]|uniref:uncharacterized protein n=1 Tax=Morchella sextelata TaxID=1174677 RepID=UPI001D0451FF|nr:uncharacterized protein H6S33_010332 [Morchella sextelata]KAH0612280.1 hypothetical protein H6S33_010332 [Morchella sextelata]
MPASLMRRLGGDVIKWFRREAMIQQSRRRLKTRVLVQLEESQCCREVTQATITALSVSGQRFVTTEPLVMLTGNTKFTNRHFPTQ